MKRKAEDSVDAPIGASKRQLSNVDPALDLAAFKSAAASTNSTTTSTPPDDNNTITTAATTPPPTSKDDNNKDDDNITHPLTPTATSIATTGATSRRNRKFPSDLKTIKCTYPSCPKTFNRPARLAAHLRSHTNDRPHKCAYPGCDKTYMEEKHLAQHVKGSHTHEKRYECPEPGCGMRFVTATRLRRHKAVHEGKERFKCRGDGDRVEGCGLSFRKRETLQRHVRVAHLGMAAFVCARVDGGDGGRGEECGAGFDSAGALRRHVEREHGELKFWCEECGKWGGRGGGEEDGEEDEDEEDEDGESGGSGGRRVGFRTLLALQTHMRKEHVNCVFCDVRCGSLADLERHVDMYHSGTTVEDRKTVECTWEGCGKKFTRTSNLNTHIRTAHEGKRFVCGQVDTFEIEDIADWNWMEEGCGNGFASKVKLEEHIRYVHLGRERPPRLYTVKSARPGEADDMSAAVPSRTIACSVEGCDAKFIRHADLDKHMQKAHCEVLDVEDAIDPRLQQTNADGDPFWIESTVPAVNEPSFDTEWAEMRRLIDLDGLVEEKEQAST